MSYFDYSFDGQIVAHNLGTYIYTVVFLPDELAAELPFDQHPRLRMSGEVGGIPVDGAWQPAKGRWYLMLNKRVLKAGELRLGDEVPVWFNIVDQNQVNIPAALSSALADHEDASAAWDDLSAGKQRGMAYWVGSAKTEPTRLRRVQEVLQHLRAGTWLR